MKINKFSLVATFAVIVSGIFFAVDSKAADNVCSPGCISPQVCVQGSCLLPSHEVPPNSAIIGTNGAIQNNVVPGTTTEESQIIKCGRPGQNMCTLCDLIAGMNNIIQYLMKIAIIVALLAVTIGGVMYVVSAGDTGLADMAKKTITNAAVGFVIIFAAFLIIDTTINYLGTKPGMGINVTSWGQFVCAPGIH
jgi:hypothetical protein